MGGEESFQCSCNSGYSGDGVNYISELLSLYRISVKCWLYIYNILFVDINECASDTDNCAEQATCIDNDGSYICTCNYGYYTGNGIICDSEN